MLCRLRRAHFSLTLLSVQSHVWRAIVFQLSARRALKMLWVVGQRVSLCRVDYITVLAILQNVKWTIVVERAAGDVSTL